MEVMSWGMKVMSWRTSVNYEEVRMLMNWCMGLLILV